VISFQKQRNSIFIGFTSGRLDRASRRSLLKSFPRSNGTLEYSEILDIIRTVATSSGRLAETSQTMSTSEIQLLVEYCLTWRPEGVALTSGHLQCLSVRHCGASGRFQGPVQTVAQEPAVFVLDFARTLPGHR
jgi:hypothetical protein